MYRGLPAILVAVVATAQTPAGSAADRFEVASIKPKNGADRTVYLAAPSPGTFRAENVWLRFLVQIAWDVRNYQVVGGPGWTGSDRYDINAKAEGRLNFNQMKPMLKALLEESLRSEAACRDTRDADLCPGDYPKREASGNERRKLHGASSQFAGSGKTSRLRGYRDESPQYRRYWNTDGAACSDALKHPAADGGR